MPARRRPLILQAPLDPKDVRAKKQDRIVCVYVLANVVVVMLYFLILIRTRSEQNGNSAEVVQHLAKDRARTV